MRAISDNWCADWFQQSKLSGPGIFERMCLCDGFYLHFKFLCVTRGNRLSAPPSVSEQTHGHRLCEPSHTRTHMDGCWVTRQGQNVDSVQNLKMLVSCYYERLRTFSVSLPCPSQSMTTVTTLKFSIIFLLKLMCVIANSHLTEYYILITITLLRIYLSMAHRAPCNTQNSSSDTAK